MPSSFGQYTGGIAPVQGISEAGARIGQMAESGYANFGKSLADGIKAYNDNDQKNQVLTQQLQGLAAQYQEVYDMYSKNPEMKPFADSLVPTMEQLNKFGSMSLSQKSGALLSGQAAYNQIAPHLQMFKDNQLSITKQGVQDALSKEVRISDNQGGYVTGTPFSTARTIEENLALAKKSFEVQAKVGNLKSFDIESALEKLTAQWENSFASDPNMAKTDPALRDAILKNISDYRNQGKLAGELAGQSSEDYGTGENIMGQVSALSEAQKGASTSAAKALESQDMAAMLAAQKKAGITSETGTVKPLLTATQKYETAKTELSTSVINNKNKIDELNLIIRNPENKVNGAFNTKAQKALEERSNLELQNTKNKNTLKTIEESDFKDDSAPVDTRPIEQILAERKVSEVKPKTAEDAVINDFAKSVIADTQKTLENTIRTGGNITVGDIARHINRFEIQNNPTVSEKIITSGGFDGGYAGGYGVVKAPSRYSDAGSDVTKAAAKLEIPTDKPMTADQMYKLSKELENQSVLTGTKAIKAAKTLEELTPETVGLGTDTTITPVNKYEKTFDYRAQIQEGVKEGTRQETFAEEKERVRQWFVTNNKGIIPSSLEEVYSSIRPETSVRFMNAPDGLGGKIMITPKGAQYIPPDKTTAVTAEQISKNTLYSYGTRTPDGQIIPEERAKGSGIKLAGIASGGEEGAKEFKKLHDDTVKARIIIPKLLAMYKQGKISRTLIPQSMWGDAESLLAQLKAAIRVETVGTGPVALPEHAMILERIGDPRKFFQFDTIGESKLNSIMKSMEDSLVHNSAGISVSISPSKTDFANSVQQAKLEARTKK